MIAGEKATQSPNILSNPFMLQFGEGMHGAGTLTIP